MTRCRPLLPPAALLLGLLGTSSAGASQSFPEALRQKLDLPQIAGSGPGCQLCHRDDIGGLRTATKPFARSMLQAGLTAANVPSLLAALDTLEAEGTDSDRDGVTDIAELEAGEDPNTASGAQPSVDSDVPLPRTGCSSSSSPPAGPSAALLAGLAWLLVRRRASSR